MDDAERQRDRQDLRERLQELVAATSAMTDDLWRYLSHSPTCLVSSRPGSGRCTCGLALAVKHAGLRLDNETLFGQRLAWKPADVEVRAWDVMDERDARRKEREADGSWRADG